MAANLKEVRIRIQSVISTQQITKAMKMVSAAKLRRAQDAIVHMRPYAVKLQNILGKIAASLQGEVQMELAEEREVRKVLIVLITSDRGLAGSYNSNLIKLAASLIQERYARQNELGNVTLMTIGKKGLDYYKKRFPNLDTTNVGLFHTLDFDNVGRVAEYIINAFRNGKYDKVEVVYSEFKNAATQRIISEQYLPIVKPEPDTESKVTADYIFEPDVELIINELMPRILRTQFYKYMLDANASEHGARMTAMDKATENANDLLKDLRLKYNQARQAAITTELTEIVSGAAALEGN
jgi:F-type H+-transporting ATPase subunit gamma